jgi:hypothetical protein
MLPRHRQLACPAWQKLVGGIPDALPLIGSQSFHGNRLRQDDEASQWLRLRKNMP